MTPKERMISAFHFIEPDDKVPSWEIEFQLYNQLLGKEPVTGFAFDNLTQKEKEAAIFTNAEILVETAERLDWSAIGTFPGYWEIAPSVPATLWIREEKWRIQLIKAIREIAGNRFFIIGSSDSTIGIPPGDKINEFVIAMFEDPDTLIKLIEKRLENGIEEGMKAANAGADAVFNASDIAFNTGCFFTPQQFDDFIGPYLGKWASHFKKEGIYTIYHTDGNITKIMDKLAATGIDALQCIDPIAGMDIVKLKEEYYKKITLIGNIDTRTLQFGTTEEIETECRKVLENCKKGGGYVFGACNAIYQGIPIENYLSMTKTKQKYGDYKSER